MIQTTQKLKWHLLDSKPFYYETRLASAEITYCYSVHADCSAGKYRKCKQEYQACSESSSSNNFN